MNVPEIVAELKELQSERVKVLKDKVAVANRQKAAARLALGFSTALDEDERDHLRERANVIVKAAQNDEPLPEDLNGTSEKLEMILSSYEKTKQALEQHSKWLADDMQGLAQQLPAWNWAEDVKGVGSLSFAQIVGEVGRDLCMFPNPAKLWKWFGLAVNDKGRAQGRDGGICPKRRKSVATHNVGIPLRNQNDGKYREVYDSRRAHTEENRDWPDGHVDNDAVRIMTKAFLKDLLLEWHKRS